MKAKFKFKVGDEVTAASGFTARISMCAVTAGGIKYRLANEYAEEWVPEEELKLTTGKEPDVDKE